MKVIFLIIMGFLFLECSFDNKTGIWKNNNKVTKEIQNRFKDFETIYTEEKLFNSIIEPANNLNIILDKPITSYEWKDEFYKSSNNLDNFNYKNLNEIIFKSKKISKKNAKDKILFIQNNVIATNTNGDVIVFSIEQKQIIFQFNFYQKRIKKFKKILNTIVEENIIYISDNLGYIYAIDFQKQKLKWAKNYKIPFRSNLKIANNKIYASNQDNSLLIINKLSGEQIRSIPTEEIIIKNKFVNSLAIKDTSLFFLNNYGSLYSIDILTNKINWFINLNRSVDLNPSDLFYSNPILAYQDKIIVSTDPYFYILSAKTGSTLSKNLITSLIKPIISKGNIFLITKDNLLVCKNLGTQKILYSLDINQEIANFLGTKKKSINVKDISIVNGNIYLFLENSYLVKFDLNGKLLEIIKLKHKLKSFPIFVNQSILFLSNKNNIIVMN